MSSDTPPFGSVLGRRATGIVVLAASTVAGCAIAANLSQFDNAQAGADATIDESGIPDAEDVDVTVEAGGDAAPDTSANHGDASDAAPDQGRAEAGADGGAEAGPGPDGGDGAPACTCSSYGATSVSCDMPCAPACASYFGDCNAGNVPNPDDGCEVYLDSLSSCRASCAETPTSCSPTQVCSAGACVAPQGLVVFTVPLTTAAQIQRYADRPPLPWSIPGAQIIVRAYAPGATGGAFWVYLSDMNSNTGPQMLVNLADLSKGWTDIELSAANAGGTFDPTMVKQVTLEVQAGSAGPWTNPTVVYVDSVRATNVTVDDTFDSTSGNMVPSSLMTVAGSTLAWQPSIVPPVADGGADAADAGPDSD